eukprot:976183-Lingulodinium_polyedra.AAC.1
MLMLGQDIRSQWDRHFEYFARASTAFVGMSWLLQWGALTLPGAFADGLRDLPEGTDEPGAKEQRNKLLSNPTSGSCVRDYL